MTTSHPIVSTRTTISKVSPSRHCPVVTVQQFELGRQIAESAAKRLMPGHLRCEHTAIEAVRPEAAQRRQLDLTVEQKVDPFQPCLDSGVRSTLLSCFGQGTAEALQIISREAAHDRCGREQRLVEDDQGAPRTRSCADVPKQQRVKEEILLGQHHQIGGGSDLIELIGPRTIAAIYIALDAARAQGRLGKSGTATAFEILPGRISDAAKPPRPRVENDDRLRRESAHNVDLVDDAAGRSHVDDQIVVMLERVAH